ncbi:MAG TPA: hypothetical protein VIF32_00070 [Gemmatimonadaceae bacterium]
MVARSLMVHQPLVPQPISNFDFGHAVHELTELSLTEMFTHVTNASGDLVFRDVECDATLSFPSSHHVKA